MHPDALVKMRPLTRRVLMASLAFALGCYYLLERLPVDRQEFLGYALTSVMLVVGLVVAAFLLVALIKGVGRLLRSSDRS